jgi:hypothetical protein
MIEISTWRAEPVIDGDDNIIVPGDEAITRSSLRRMLR